VRQFVVEGTRIGRLVCLGAREVVNKCAVYLWRCDCGGEKRIAAANVASGRARSCGCARFKHDLTGQSFGRWCVLARAAGGGSAWMCRCACGNTRKVTTVSLTAGNSRSCGCLKRELMSARLRSVWSKLERGDRTNGVFEMWRNARNRARRKGVPFTIQPEDVAVPTVCPVLGIPLVRNKGLHHHGSPSIDRRKPELGYVPGNVLVISHRANGLKSDASVHELERVTAYVREIQKGAIT